MRRISDRISSETTFGIATSVLNDLLHREKGETFQKGAIADAIWQDGLEKERDDTIFMHEVFRETEWLDRDGIICDESKIPESIKHPESGNEGRDIVDSKIKEIIEAYNSGKEESAQIKDRRLIDEIEHCPEKTVFVMMDGIVVPFQKPHRNVNGVVGMTREKRFTEITNACIISVEGCYYFTGSTENEVMKKVLAYLVYHGLLEDRELIFFADGAVSIKNLVKKYFSFREYSYYIDWYHVHKKCYELFSMALYGGKKNKERNAKIRYEFFRRLWAGNIDDALSYLDSLETEVVKSESMLESIKKYIGESKRDDLYCFALRKGMKLINSSSRCEKQNDILVGKRCKGNAMSWSSDGSLYMSQVRALFLTEESNDDDKSFGWFSTHKPRYNPVPLSDTLKEYMRAA